MLFEGFSPLSCPKALAQAYPTGTTLVSEEHFSRPCWETYCQRTLVLELTWGAITPNSALQAQPRTVLMTGTQASASASIKRKTSGSEHRGPCPSSSQQSAHPAWLRWLLPTPTPAHRGSRLPQGIPGWYENASFIRIWATRTLRVQHRTSPMGIQWPWRITVWQKGGSSLTWNCPSPPSSPKMGSESGLSHHTALLKQCRIQFLVLAKQSQICNY